MKILVLMGSPRKKGNTAKVLSWITDDLLAAGHEIETVYLNEKRIKGCLACAGCKEKEDMIACVQKDDAPDILHAMIKSDLIIFASPLYFWGFSSQMKSIIDRTYSLYNRYHQPGHTSLIEGRKTVLVVTGGGGFSDNAEPVFTAFDRMQVPWKTVKAGELFVGPCSTPEALGRDAMDQARELAAGIIDQAAS